MSADGAVAGEVRVHGASGLRGGSRPDGNVEIDYKDCDHDLNFMSYSSTYSQAGGDRGIGLKVFDFLDWSCQCYLPRFKIFRKSRNCHVQATPRTIPSEFEP